MQNFIGQKVLITTSAWFYGKDGRSYRAVHGTLKAVHEVGKTLGFIPNRAHANWFYEVGEMVIMGCQVMYVVQCNEVEKGPINDWTTDGQGDEKVVKEYLRPTAIYIVD